MSFRSGEFHGKPPRDDGLCAFELSRARRAHRTGRCVSSFHVKPSCARLRCALRGVSPGVLLVAAAEEVSREPRFT